jgi:hypothetical protein
MSTIERGCETKLPGLSITLLVDFGSYFFFSQQEYKNWFLRTKMHFVRRVRGGRSINRALVWSVEVEANGEDLEATRLPPQRKNLKDLPSQQTKMNLLKERYFQWKRRKPRGGPTTRPFQEQDPPRPERFASSIVQWFVDEWTLPRRNNKTEPCRAQFEERSSAGEAECKACSVGGGLCTETFSLIECPDFEKFERLEDAVDMSSPTTADPCWGGSRLPANPTWDFGDDSSVAAPLYTTALTSPLDYRYDND